MSQAAVFEAMCDALEQNSELTRLQARGVVRLALKDAGLEIDGLNKRQATVVIDKLLPERLVRQGIDADIAGGLTEKMRASLEAVAGEATQNGPDAMLNRLDEAMGRR